MKVYLDQSERLRLARKNAGYKSAADASQAMGIESVSYNHHENGTRGLSRVAERYARFFRVSLEWLLTGRGDIKQKNNPARVPLMGTVGAGPAVEPIGDAAWADAADYKDLPDPAETFILKIVGDSAIPKYMPGDYLMVSRAVVLPEQMIGRYCVLDLADGRRVVKKLTRIRGAFVLNSLNADVEEAPMIIGCYEILGTLT
jgi:SOS-response transcriptional repressor LexA